MSVARISRLLPARLSLSQSYGAIFVRSMADDKKKPSGKKSNSTAPASTERGIALRLNEFQVLKDAPAVEELPDKDYPEWLWSVHIPGPTLADLRKIGFEEMNEQQRKRYFKLQRREVIKNNNAGSAKS